MIRKTISLLLAVFMLLTMAMPTNAYAASNDYAGHWAEETIQLWLNEGRITGYPDGSFKPNGNITRAEFVTMVNKLFSFNETTDINFSDVNEDDWYYQEVQKAFKEGYIAGVSETQFAPNSNLTREQAAVIVAKVMKLEINSEAAGIFTDNNKISSWALDFVGAAAKSEFIKGYIEDNTFKPHNFITRAEAVVTLNRTIDSKDLTVDEAGTVVENQTVRNLYITKNVGDGDVTLKNVTVTGELLVEGGGLNTVTIEDSKINKLTTNKADGKVRILLKGGSEVDLTSILSGATLEQQDLTGDGFADVVIEKNANTSQTITIKADIKELSFKATIKVNVVTGVIESIIIDEAAEDLIIDLGEGVKVLSAVVNAKVSFTGKGTIEKAEVNADGVTFEKKPTETIVAPGVKEPEVVAPVTGGGSSGGSSGGDSGPVNPDPQNLNLEIELSDSLLYINDDNYHPDIKIIKFNGTEIYNDDDDDDEDSTKEFDKITKAIGEHGISLKFKSDNSTIVSVDEKTGMMTSHNIVGDTNIKVIASKSGHKNAEFTFNAEVIIPVESVKISSTTSTSISIKGTVQLNATVYPENATYKSVTWSTSNEKVAKVNDNGLVTGVSTGTAIISAEADCGRYGSKETIAECKITVGDEDVPVIPVESITVLGSDGVTTITTKGGTLLMTAVISPDDATYKAVSWSVTPKNIATISQNGLLTAISNGTVTVIATAKDESGIVGTKDIKITNQTEDYADDFFETEDFGLWGSSWEGAYNLGWRYAEDFDTETIGNIEVGMLDAEGKLIVRYTADSEQIAWQKINGYINASTKQSSAPFYQFYNGVAIKEGRDSDWTVVKGESFTAWTPASAYVKVINTNGTVCEKTVNYVGTPVEPAEVIINLPEKFVVGEKAELTVTTKANDDAGIFVIGNSEFSDSDIIETLEYYEVKNDTWYPLTGDFGPVTGFELKNDTSKFRVSFNATGSYEFTVNIREAENHENIIASKTASFIVEAPAYSDDFFEAEDFGLWGSSWEGAYNLGWRYAEDFDIETIADIEVGMLDVEGKLIVRYTADSEQIAWQKINGYINASTKQSSAPFYQSYNGVAIKEGRDSDWTVVKGESFTAWTPASAYVKVVNTSGTVCKKAVTYVATPEEDTSTIISASYRASSGGTDKGGIFVNINFGEVKVRDLSELEVILYNGESKLVTNALAFDRIDNDTKESSELTSPFNFGSTGNNQWSWNRGAYPVGEEVTQSDVPTKVVINYVKGGKAYTAIKEVSITLPEPIIANVINSTKNIGYDTIQEAISDAGVEDTIIVKAGTYKEQLIIDKSVTLLGPNASIVGYGDREDEAVITYPEELEDSYLELISINADNVTISGFTLDDGNYSSNTVETNGINAHGNNIVVSNNVVDGFNRVQILVSAYIYNYENSKWELDYIDGAVVEGNYAKNALDYTAIYLQGAAGKVEDNKVENAPKAIQIQPYAQSIGGTVINNDLSGYITGIWYNYARRGAGEWTIGNNNINATEVPATVSQVDWQGIAVQNMGTEAIGHAPKVEFINNTIDGSNAARANDKKIIGIDFVPKINDEATIAFRGNTIANVDIVVSKGSGKVNLDELLENNNLPNNSAVLGNEIKVLEAGKVYNINGKIYDTIHAAVAEAESGSTILVAKGVYALPKQLKITKPLSIIGNGEVVITVADSFEEGTYSADKHLISINDVRGLVELENLVIEKAKRTGINIFESDNVKLKNINSKDNLGAGLVINNSIVVANDLNTSGNGWGYGINIDNGSNPSIDAPATKFTLNSGIVAEVKQIVSDNGNVEIIAPNYSIFIKDPSKVFSANITGWYGEENKYLDTSVNFDFDKVNISNIDSLKFSLYNDNVLLGTRFSTGNNLVTLLKDCAKYWGETEGSYTLVKGIRTMSSAFMYRTEEFDNGYWISSPCTASNTNIPNKLVVEVVLDNITYTATYLRK